MRISALPLLMLAGAAQAAPATTEQADRWLDAMQRGLMSRMLIAEFDPVQQDLRQNPMFQEIEDAKVGCLRWLLQQMAYEAIREQAIERFGDTGEQDMQAWLSFLKTPGGKIMEANLAGADARDVSAITARMTAAERSAAMAFLGSPVAERGMRAIDFDDLKKPRPRPSGLNARVAAECGIQLTAHEES